jgi:peptide/nickel transport system permease protein
MTAIDTTLSSTSRLAGGAIRSARAWPSLTAGLIVLAIFVVVALGADLIRPYHDAITIDMTNRLQPPSVDHFFGTDEYGRDIFSRIVHGARTTLLVAIASVLIASAIGIPLGLSIGYVGGAYEAVVSRILDALFAFPVVLLAILIVTIIGPGIVGAMIAIGVAAVPTTARIVRSSMVAERQNEYVEASMSLGSSTLYIIFRVIVPNLMGPILVLVSLGLAYATLDESGLSFLGLGAQSPVPEWGSMLAAARQFLMQAPSYAFFPAAAIFLLVFSLNLVGDGLRDVTDPRRVTR